MCVHAGYSIEQCPDGEYVRKFDLVNIVDGDGNLQPYFRPDCIEISKPKNLNCPPGEILQGYDPDDGIVCRRLIASDINAHFTGNYNDCTTSSTFPIRASGSAINVTCGTPAPTATATPTPTATSTPNTPPRIACISVNANTFHVALRLANSLDPLIAGRKINLSVTGVTKGGSLLGFKCKYQTDGISAHFSATDLQDRVWPGSPHTGLGSWSDESYSYISIKKTDALANGEYIFSCGASQTVPNFVNNEVLCVDSLSAGSKCNIFSESLGQALTGLEDTTSLEICAEDTESIQAMFADETNFAQY